MAIKTPEYLNVNETLSNNADTGSRYFGGADLNDHPFIRGYFQVFFELPSAIFGQEQDSTANQILTASVQSFTPPGDTTLNVADVMGQGGVGSSFVTGQTIARDFSLTMQEKYRSPIWTIFKTWTSAIIDPYIGVSTVLASQPGGFIAKNYKGRCMVIETQPVKFQDMNDDDIKKNIVRVYYFDGVFPTSDNLSQFNADVTANDVVTLTIPFRFDGHPLTDKHDKTLEKAIQYMKNKNLYERVTNYYGNVYQYNA